MDSLAATTKKICKVFVKTNAKIICSWILQSLLVLIPIFLLHSTSTPIHGNSILFTCLLYTTAFYWIDILYRGKRSSAIIAYILTIFICFAFYICGIDRIITCDDSDCLRWIPLPHLFPTAVVTSLYSLAFIKAQKWTKKDNSPEPPII